ncbi:MAG: hypothetical protein JRH11_28260 [Deltaproteobacteria bacterium]|nr:hypothetical protein [Deltaproteobacteria bacterium]
MISLLRNSLTRLSLLLSFLLLALSACGGTSRSFVVLERENAGDIMEAIHQASLARGFDSRLREERQVTFYLDRELGTRVTFQVKRRGVVLVVRAAEGEDVPQAQTDGELLRAETVGREIMTEARVVFADLERERYAEVEAERVREEQAEQAEQEVEQRSPQQQADFDAFMANHNERRQGRLSEGESDTDDSGGGGGSGMSCCVNGAFYECPSAGAADQCVGRFTRCVSQCGGDCFEQCLQTDPPDPSACSRAPGRDGEC